MTATQAQAVEEVFTALKAAWDTTGHPMAWPNVQFSPPAPPAPWARATVLHGDAGQRTLSGETGARRFGRSGTLVVQIFFGVGQGLSAGHDLAKVVRDAFEGERTANGVWFRSVSSREVGPDGEWFQINVVAQFEYDEVK